MTILRKHQEAACAFAETRPASLIAAACGGGKSCIAITLAERWGADTTLVLCPSSVRGVWRREWPKHQTRDTTVYIADEGSVRTRTGDMNLRWIAAPRPLVVVVNYEAIWREPMARWLRDRAWDLIVADEGSRIMRMGRAASQCYKLTAAHKLSMDGTPLTQDAISVWGQCNFLDPDVFGLPLPEFTERYLNKAALRARKAWLRLADTLHTDAASLMMPLEWLLVGTKNTREYLEMLAKVAFRCEVADLDLPPLTIDERTFRLSDRARGLYEAIQGKFLPEVESGDWPDVTGSYAITMRLQQITSGWLPDARGTIRDVDDGKRRLLRDLLVEFGGEPCVVFARFTHDLEITREISAELGLRYAEISQRRKDGIDRLGLMPEWCQVNGVQEQAGGVGVDLSMARLMVDYSPSWRRDKTVQKIARVWRPPQTRPSILYALRAEDTIDGEIKRAIQARQAIVDHVWSGLASLPQGHA
jgi:SNF2 family DNA or RNA helicase